MRAAPRLFGCLVVQNEADVIDDLLASLRRIDIFEKIFFYDLGSVDRTFQRALRHLDLDQLAHEDQARPIYEHRRQLSDRLVRMAILSLSAGAERGSHQRAPSRQPGGHPALSVPHTRTDTTPDPDGRGPVNRSRARKAARASIAAHGAVVAEYREHAANMSRNAALMLRIMLKGPQSSVDAGEARFAPETQRPLDTQFESPTLLTATVPEELYANPGVYPVYLLE
jgi:hypothetical protein